MRGDKQKEDQNTEGGLHSVVLYRVDRKKNRLSHRGGKPVIHLYVFLERQCSTRDITISEQIQTTFLPPLHCVLQLCSHVLQRCASRWRVPILCLRPRVNDLCQFY